MIKEIDRPEVQAKIYKIAASRTRHAGMPEEASKVAEEVIAFQQKVKDQRTFFQQFKTFDPSKLPELSPLGERVNFLAHLARFGQVRRDSMERRGLTKVTSPRSI